MPLEARASVSVPSLKIDVICADATAAASVVESTARPVATASARARPSCAASARRREAVADAASATSEGGVESLNV